MEEEGDIIRYDSVWAIGPCCFSQFLLQALPCFYQGHGPLSMVGTQNLSQSVSLLLSHCDGMLDLEDLDVIYGAVVNTRKRLLLRHLFAYPGKGEGRDLELSTRHGIELAYPRVRDVFSRRRRRFYATMENPEAHPLFIFASLPVVHEEWEAIFSLLGEPDWGYHPEEARREVERLRKAFPAQSSLLYLGYDPSLSAPQLDSVSDSLVLARHPYGKKEYLEWGTKRLAHRLDSSLPQMRERIRQQARGGKTVWYPQLNHGRRIASPTFCQRVRGRVGPIIPGASVRLYLFTFSTHEEHDFASDPVNFIPIFLWGAFYAQHEGVEDVVIVSHDHRVRTIAKALGFRVLTREEYEREDLTSLDLLILLRGDIPFHRSGGLKEMARRGMELSYLATQTPGVEVINLKRKDGAREVISWAYPFLFTVSDARTLSAAQVLAESYGERNDLFPTLVSSIILIQNQHDWDWDYSAFVDSCDLVFRVNLMDSLIPGTFGERCDGLICGDSDYFMEQARARDYVISDLPSIPFLYATQGKLNEVPGFDHGYSLVPLTRSLPYYWTTSLFAVHILRCAFPRAKFYTTGVKSLLRFNARTLHTKYVLSNGSYLWGLLQSLSEVEDIMEAKEKYGEKRNTSDRERYTILVSHPKWRDEVFLNLRHSICIRSAGQHLGRILFDHPLMDGEVRVEWLYNGKRETYVKMGKEYELKKYEEEE